MTVYLVMTFDYHVVGIFSSRKKAQDCIKSRGEEGKDDTVDSFTLDIRDR